MKKKFFKCKDINRKVPLVSADEFWGISKYKSEKLIVQKNKHKKTKHK